VFHKLSNTRIGLHPLSAPMQQIVLLEDVERSQPFLLPLIISYVGLKSVSHAPAFQLRALKNSRCV